MTEQQKREAVGYIEGQLKNGYVDLSSFDEDALEMVKEMIFLWKSINRISIEDWKRLGYTDEEAEELVEASYVYKSIDFPDDIEKLRKEAERVIMTPLYLL